MTEAQCTASDPIVEVVQYCLDIDSLAIHVYSEFGRTCQDSELQAFWAGLAEEESRHVAFWAQALRLAREGHLPHLFDDTDATVSELRQALDATRALLGREHAAQSPGDAFLVAFRLEFMMLHPAFEALFHLLRPIAGEYDPEDDYAAHLQRFEEMLRKRGQLTPELELLSATLRSLWTHNKRLAVLAARDPLTGAYNRRAFMEFSRHVAFFARRTGQPLGLLMIDVDDFKAVNDRFGHGIGDDVLCSAVRAIEGAVRGSDVVGRFGGEEFAVLLPDASASSLRRIGEKLSVAITEASSAQLRVTVSVGAASCVVEDAPDATLTRLISRADAALYRAKAMGKDCIVVD